MNKTETLLISIIGAVIAGLILFGLQIWREKWKEKKEILARKMVGKRSLKIIDKDFLSNYVPGKVSIEKIIEEFGKPYKKNRGVDDEKRGLYFYKYIFQNAKVEFCTYDDETDIISIAVYSELDQKHPIYCAVSPEDEGGYFGQAKISDSIIENEISFENFSSPRDAFAIIKTRYTSYTPIKYLYFCYRIEGNYESISDTKGQIIQQVCVTQLDSICETFSIWDTFYA